MTSAPEVYFPCPNCRATDNGFQQAVVKFCPVHAAAPILLAALEVAVASEMLNKGDDLLARAAILLAKGESA